MTTTTADAPQRTDSSPTAAHRLLAALRRRDLPGMAEACAPDVRFRALIPPGTVTADNAVEVGSRFAAWFGGDDSFDVVDAAIDRIGARMHLRWRVRMQPEGHPELARVAEQHLFATGDDLFTSLDLLCSGFQPDRA